MNSERLCWLENQRIRRIICRILLSVLEDEEVRVQHTALQALREVTDPGLLEIYERLLRQHKTNKDYIRSNIKTRLEEFALTSLEQINKEIPADWTHVRGMLKKIVVPS
ncbi:hypothetical protein ABER23_07395 [Paenibacillus lautus]|uniref:hypothetical protein n=1 Tax=Paenibacillus lautus TaxID=1401 RepID=UPI003D2E0648